VQAGSAPACEHALVHATAIILLVVAGAIVTLVMLVRRRFSRHGSGRLAQLEFKRRYGAELARRLDGSVDPRVGSPWVAIRLGERPARLVAATLAGRIQAGVDLVDHELPLQVFYARAHAREVSFDAPPSAGEAAEAERLVDALDALDVENVASPAPGATHVLRVNADDVDQLVERLGSIAPLLAQLEALGRAVEPQAPNS
jgi:hypothetical protein